MDTRIKIIQVGAGNDDVIDQIVQLTARFSAESHIYDQLGFNREKFRLYLQYHTLAPACVLAAVRDGLVLGYAIFVLDEAYIDETNFEIITIFVPPEHRKTGAGSAIADALVATMDLNGCKYGQIAICCAMKENAELIDKLTANLFAKRGFYQIGIIMGRRGKTWDS